jgi:hypothetical protein
MSTKNYIKYGDPTLKTFDITYYDTELTLQNSQSAGKSKLFYNDATGFGIAKCDFSLARTYQSGQKLGVIEGNTPTPVELIEESVNIGEVSFALYIEKNSREVQISHIKGDISTVFNRRMIINIVGLWSYTE